MEALQAACLAVHAPPSGPDGERRRAEAEAVLEHFKRSPSALPDAMALLRARDPPALPVVQFHCVATVREVTLKKWSLLGVQDKAQALDFLMQMLYERYAELPRFVAGAALQTVVLLMKRGWLDRAQPERDAIIQQMGQMLLAQSDSGVVNSVTTRLIAAKWLLAFVTEFSSASRASAMHQPIEFHTKTRRVLEKQGLKELLGFAILLLEDSIRSTTMSTAGPAEGGAAEVPPEQLELLETAFLLCIEILNWNFVDNRAGNLAWSLSSSLDKGDESRPVITPQESWRPVLVRPELIHSAFNTYAFFRNLGTKNETLLHLARQFLILLASVQGPIFARKEEQVSFLCETFRGVTEIIRHPFLDMISKTDYAGFEIATREMIDCCQLFFRLANNIGLKALVHAPAQMFQTFLEELSGLSCKLLQSALQRIQRHLRTNPGDTVDDLWELEGVEVLLDAWVSLSADSLLDGSAEAPPNEVEAISAMISKYSSPVIQLYLQTQLELSAVEALAEQNEEEDVDDDSASGSREQFELAAALARMSAAETGALLLHLFETLMAGIQQALADLNGQDSMSPALSQLFEKLHFVILFAGLFLADDYAGERPSIPSRIHATMQGVPVSAEPPVIVKLIVLVMSQLVEFEASRIARNSASDTISPFVSEQLFNTITRLAATYLAPDTLNHEGEIAPALLTVFGYKMGGRAEELVHFLIQQSTTYLLHWPTQPVVMQNLMEFLLVLSNTRAISCVLGAPMWQTLVQANASAGTFITATAGADPLHVAVARIPCTLRGQLTEALCRAAMTSDNNDTKTLCFQSISRPVESRLQQLIALPNFASKQTTNDVRVQEELKLILELYSGIARSAESTSHGLIAGFSLPVLPVIVKIFHMFHGDSQIVTSILSFFCLLVEAQICYLTPRDALQVYSSCNELITGYCRHNLGKKSVLGDAEEESYADLLALLQLLSHLVSKDFIDFSDHTAEQAEVDHASSVVSDVVFSGLSRVIPLMTEQLLQYPSLSKQYFTLISYMVEVYAEKLSSLPTNLFGMLLHSLLFGMRHVQIEVVRYSFQAVGELASYHWKAQQKKEAGLETHRAANPDIFVHFIRCIFRMALFEDFNPVVLDYCASALYPLILIEQSRYFSIAEEISNDQPDPASQQRLMTAFGELTQFVSAADIAMGTATTRKFRMQFKSNLYAFVADARGFIQMK